MTLEESRTLDLTKSTGTNEPFVHGINSHEKEKHNEREAKRRSNWDDKVVKAFVEEYLVQVGGSLCLLL